MNLIRVLVSTFLFLLVFLTLNYYVFLGISYTFNLPINTYYYVILVIVALCYPVSNFLIGFYSNSLIRGVYAVSASWLGISVYILILFAIYLIMGIFIQIPVEIAGKVIFAVAFITGIYAVFKATRLKIENLTIPLNGIESDIRAVQISDVHIGPVRSKGFVKKLVDKILDLDPEVVFITGDLFDGSSKLPDDIIKDFGRIKVPVLFIMGNHDFYQGFDEVLNYLETADIKILNFAVFEFNGLQIVGVPFSWKRKYLEDSLEKIEFEKDKHTILLYHLPREFQVSKDAGIDLQLSGHTHAGQFYPFNLFVKLMFPYLRGLYENQGSYLYVSQGTGTLGPPLRLGSSCEITLINLKRI
jgi:uncharacterized protein